MRPAEGPPDLAHGEGAVEHVIDEPLARGKAVRPARVAGEHRLRARHRPSLGGALGVEMQLRRLEDRLQYG